MNLLKFCDFPKVTQLTVLELEIEHRCSGFHIFPRCLMASLIPIGVSEKQKRKLYRGWSSDGCRAKVQKRNRREQDSLALRQAA